MLNLKKSIKELRDAQPFVTMDSNSSSISKEPIAIIGIDGKVGGASTLTAIWEAFRNGYDMISDLPFRRYEDARKMHYLADRHGVERFAKKAYLDEIDQFDAAYFQMAPIEAEMMDPVHRIYLLSAWRAIEDAGYNHGRLAGTKTGVFVGYNSLNNSYAQWLNGAPDETLGIQVSGNISSFIASRLSFLLDLHGPSMLIDTACSSGLVALHEACRALRSGELDTAIVGSIRLYLCPTEEENIGTTSSSKRTRSFDASADGTGSGEGVINFVLKPLHAAKRDGDYIYALIQGSAINQDGTSLGLTAPNTNAQARVLHDAWLDAGIHPEEISYMEAHGTATKLGDPIELGGISAAFSMFTNKKQFCALGSSKTNFGHLDCAAGLLGVLKIILMMQHRQLVPSIHFAWPNKELSFLQSPVYLNDRLRGWRTSSNRLIAGVSAFGMSGTNCHVVMESADFLDGLVEKKENGACLYAVGGRSRKHVMRLIQADQTFLRNHPMISFTEYCMSQLQRRDGGRFRFAQIFTSRDEFLTFPLTDIEKSRAYREIPDSPALDVKMHSETLFASLSNQTTKNVEGHDEILAEVANAFLNGEEIKSLPWEDIIGKKLRRVPTAVLPFCERRVWYEPKKLSKHEWQIVPRPFSHPIIRGLAFETKELHIYLAEISIDNCMELREHCINGKHVLPGTVYVDFVMSLGKNYFKSQSFIIESLTFLSPFVKEADEITEMHLLLHEKKNGCQITIQSRDNRNGWQVHAEATLATRKNTDAAPSQISLSKWLTSFSPLDHTDMAQNKKVENFIQLGEHWKLNKSAFVKNNELILAMRLPKAHEKIASAYTLYPALLDHLVNGGLHFLNGLYLPLHYSGITFFGPLKSIVYSHIRHLKREGESQEVELFHIDFYNADGKQVGEIKKYALKRVHQPKKFLMNAESIDLHTVSWQEMPADPNRHRDKMISMVLLLHPKQLNSLFVRTLEEQDARIQYLILPSDSISAEDLPDGAILVPELSEEGFLQAIDHLSSTPFVHFVNLLGVMEDQECIEKDMEGKVAATFLFTKALMQHRTKQNIEISFVVYHAYPIIEEEACQPCNRLIAGFATSLPYEDEKIRFRIIDIDDMSQTNALFHELSNTEGKLIIGYRQGIRYGQKLILVDEAKSNCLPLDNDVVVIVGGYGGMGLAISRQIFQEAPNSRVILLSRRPEDPSEESQRHDDLQSLRKLGAKIEVYQGDATNQQMLAKTFDAIRKRYEHIDHLYYAAGVAGDGFLINKSWEDFSTVLAPKVVGVRNTLRCLKKDSLKSIVFFSSFTSLTGGPGQSDYTAANAYLDAIPFEKKHLAEKVMTINWTGWSESGMAKKHHVDSHEGPYHFVSDVEGAQLFWRALTTDKPQVLVGAFQRKFSPEEYQIWERRIDLPNDLIEKERADISLKQEDEIQIYGKGPGQLTEIERHIALAWARTLHLDEVNISDKFFEVGGNSLLATYLLKEIDRFYPNRMTITDIFLYSSIEAIASYISEEIEKQNEGHDKEMQRMKKSYQTDQQNEELSDLLDQFMDGSLSMDQMEKML